MRAQPLLARCCVLAAAAAVAAAGAAPRLAPAQWPAGVSFAGTFTDNAVLQRGPQLAAVYGVVIENRTSATTSTGTPTATRGLDAATLGVSVTVTEVDTGAAYTVAAQFVEVINATYARWKAVLKPGAAGGNYTIAAACSGCAAPAPRFLHSLTFGDVFFCSGQSNMWLPVHFSLSRNRTFQRILAGKYRHIRLHSFPKNSQPDDAWPSYDPYIAPPPPAYTPYGALYDGGWLRASVGTYPCPEGGPQCGPQRGGDEWFNNTVDQFSAACWYFAEGLADIAEAHNEAQVPVGLIGSYWGGTMVEMWQPNATLNAGVCKNASGGAYAPSQLHRWDIDAGSLWNGMVLPFVNYTIRAALWYQGENNVFQCKLGRDAPLGDPDACGRVSEGSGYGCFFASLMRAWREAWSSGPASEGTTSPTFPVGVVALAGGTSEGFSNNMGAFRLSQAGGTGLLPNAAWPNTFVAQAHDVGDPGDGPAAAANRHTAVGPYSTARGFAPFTSFFMGSIHPRPKRVVGLRLAKAARALVYKDPAQAWTGPVPVACAVRGTELQVTFDPQHLRGDALAVRAGAIMTPLPLQALAPSSVWDLVRANAGATARSDFLYSSPLEVQYGGTNLTNGVWLSADLHPQCASGGNKNAPKGGVTGNPPCGIDPVTGAPQPGYNVLTATTPLPAGNSSAITAIRYAFRDNPCCPNINRGTTPCPPVSCPLQGYNSSLPAVPFVATVSAAGNCSWFSTQGPR